MAAEYLDNSGIFCLINDLKIDENEVYSDRGTEKKELEKLLEVIETGDRLIIRSVVDLAEDARDLVKILKQLDDKQVILCSVCEIYLSGNEFYTAIKGFIDITSYYSSKKQRQKFEEAKLKGIVGRPAKDEATAKAIRLYKTKSFTIAEIIDLTGISSSTLYRALKEDGKSSS